MARPNRRRQVVDKDARSIREFCSSHAGDDAFIVGTGTSLAGFDYARLRGRLTIALNDAVLTDGFDPTFHIFSDVGIWKRYRDYQLSPTTSVVCQTNARKNFLAYKKCAFKDRIFLFSNATNPNACEPADGNLYVSRTVATGAIMLAWKLGARRVFLLGVDGYRTDKAYYHDGRTKGREKRKERRIDGGRIVQDRHDCWVQNMRELRRQFDRRKIYGESWPGSNVYNLSLKSTIDSWEKRSVDDVLGESPIIRTCHVVAAFGGPRRGNYMHPLARELHEKDRAAFLRLHLQSVKRFARTVDQTIIVVAESPDEPPEFKKFIKRVGSRTRNLVLRRPNGGLEFGSWAHAYELLRAEFDRFIFIVDDHAFCRAGYDDELYRRLSSVGPRYGYVASMAIRGHVRIGDGMSTRLLLDRLWARTNGGLAAAGFPKHMPRVFRSAGMEVKTMRGAWSCLVKYKGRTGLYPSYRDMPWPDPLPPPGLIGLEYALAAPHCEFANSLFDQHKIERWWE